MWFSSPLKYCPDTWKALLPPLLRLTLEGHLDAHSLAAALYGPRCVGFESLYRLSHSLYIIQTCNVSSLITTTLPHCGQRSLLDLSNVCEASWQAAAGLINEGTLWFSPKIIRTCNLQMQWHLSCISQDSLSSCLQLQPQHIGFSKKAFSFVFFKLTALQNPIKYNVVFHGIEQCAEWVNVTHSKCITS